jgi:hypothetical protein
MISSDFNANDVPQGASGESHRMLELIIHIEEV